MLTENPNVLGDGANIVPIVHDLSIIQLANGIWR